MALSDKAKAKRDGLSRFGQWMDDTAVSKGTSLQEIAQYIGQEYTFVSRLSAGTKTPTYDMAQQIGEMVDDVAGALAAAGFSAPASPTKPADSPRPALRRLLATGDEIVLSPDDTDPEDTFRRTEAFLQALRRERTGES
ncbi:MAG: hypothetical protein V4671_07175 [Armatimonadota bacterium]